MIYIYIYIIYIHTYICIYIYDIIIYVYAYIHMRADTNSLLRICDSKRQTAQQLAGSLASLAAAETDHTRLSEQAMVCDMTHIYLT